MLLLQLSPWLSENGSRSLCILSKNDSITSLFRMSSEFRPPVLPNYITVLFFFSINELLCVKNILFVSRSLSEVH